MAINPPYIVSRIDINLSAKIFILFNIYPHQLFLNFNKEYLIIKLVLNFNINYHKQCRMKHSKNSNIHLL